MTVTMARKGTWWHKTVPEPMTVAHRSGDLRVGRVTREESMDEVGWKEARHLLDVP